MRQPYRADHVLEHNLLRLDILRTDLRRAHCSCGSHAIIRTGQHYDWIRLHRVAPNLPAGQVATLREYLERKLGE
jgi:hypothetical protein